MEKEGREINNTENKTQIEAHVKNLPPILETPQLLVPFYPRSFFSLATHKVHLLDLPKEARGKICCFSSQGWLVLLERITPSITLLNPLTSATFKLPALTTFPDILGYQVSETGIEYSIEYSIKYPWPGSYCSESNIISRQILCCVDEMLRFFISKIVVSPNPNPNSFIAMAIFGYPEKKLAYCRSGQDKWSLVEDAKFVKDVVNYNGQFYVLTHESVYVVCSFVGNTTPVLKNLIEDDDDDDDTLRKLCPYANYLVEISDELMIVIRETEFDRLEQTGGMNIKWFKTTGFKLFKLDEDLGKWTRVKSIGDHVMFAGANSALATHASLHCRADCIYFTTDFVQSYSENRIQFAHQKYVCSS